MLLGVCNSSAQNKKPNSKENVSTTKITILENAGPSLVYKINTDSSVSADIQIRSLSNELINSERASISDNFISKISVYDVVEPEFFITMNIENKEVYREKVKQNFKKQ